MTDLATETVSKGEFATMIGVSPGRVSQYISERKIFGHALDGEGRRARIRASVAAKQLKMTLDPSQRLGGNGVAGRRSEEAPAAQSAPSTPRDDGVDEIAAERLKQMRLKTAQAEREAALAIGRYMLTEDAKREMNRAVGEAFKMMDQGLRDMSAALAAQFALPERDVHLALVKAFREVRARGAEQFRTQANAEAKAVADPGESELRIAS